MSSPGCLQFSVVLRHRNSATLVFIQYVMALAVVHAVRSFAPGYEVRAAGEGATCPAKLYGRNDCGPCWRIRAIQGVELAIKWPNDIYSVSPSDSPGDPAVRRKIGGVLVNSSFGNNGFVLVVGARTFRCAVAESFCWANWRFHLLPYRYFQAAA